MFTTVPGFDWPRVCWRLLLVLVACLARFGMFSVVLDDLCCWVIMFFLFVSFGFQAVSQRLVLGFIAVSLMVQFSVFGGPFCWQAFEKTSGLENTTAPKGKKPLSRQQRSKTEEIRWVGMCRPKRTYKRKAQLGDSRGFEGRPLFP